MGFNVGSPSRFANARCEQRGEIRTRIFPRKNEPIVTQIRPVDPVSLRELVTLGQNDHNSLRPQRPSFEPMRGDVPTDYGKVDPLSVKRLNKPRPVAFEAADADSGMTICEFND